VHLGFTSGEARDKSVVKWSGAQARSRPCCRQIQASVQAPTSSLIGKSKPGETVVVAAASGPVGSPVGLLAKLAGARAVGIAGGGEKCPMWRRNSVSMLLQFLLLAGFLVLCVAAGPRIDPMLSAIERTCFRRQPAAPQSARSYRICQPPQQQYREIKDLSTQKRQFLSVALNLPLEPRSL
jgi:hypothetical protein